VRRQGGSMKPTTLTAPLMRDVRGIKTPPKFQSCVLRGQLYGLKSNTAGDWIVTLRVDADCDAEVTKLAKAHGLALNVNVVRVARESSD
jgi:hypothetical protein